LRKGTREQTGEERKEGTAAVAYALQRGPPSLRSSIPSTRLAQMQAKKEGHFLPGKEREQKTKILSVSDFFD